MCWLVESKLRMVGGYWGGTRLVKGKAHRQQRPKRWASAETLILSLLLTLALVLFMLLALAPPGHQSSPLTHITQGGGLGKRGEQWTEVLSWKPRVFLLHSFLSKEECEHLITVGRPHLQKSTVIDSNAQTNTLIESSARTSTGVFLSIGQDEIIQDIEERIAHLTFIPVEHGEALHILHYDVGQKYDHHLDYFDDEKDLKAYGQRIATLLMYLSEVEEGGETVFPLAAGRNFSSDPGWNELSKCAKIGAAVKPKMGDAVLFWDLRPDGTTDPLSLHSGCPVIRGSKWLSTKWIHVEHFVPVQL